jgi:hypothetical protein
LIIIKNKSVERNKLQKRLFYFEITLFVFLISSFTVMVNAQDYGIMWNQTYGSSEEDVANSLVQTSDGGFVVAGYTKAFDIDGDAWLVKTDASGNVEWNRTYGEEDWDRINSLVKTSDGGYALAGYTYSFSAGFGDFWLIKTDSSGNMEWNKIFGEYDLDRANSLVETSDGGFALAGYTNSFGAGHYDFWLIKTDSSGNLEWNQTYGGVDQDIAWSLIQTSDGGFVLAGETLSFGAGDHDFWLVKTDSSGNMEWNQTFGKEDYDFAYSIVESIDGGYALAGISRSEDSADFWLIKTDIYGQIQWDKRYRRGTHSGAYSLIVTSNGGYALAGYSHSIFGSTGTDFWLVKTDPYGNIKLNQTYGGTEIDHAHAVVETSDGGFALTGYTKSYGKGGQDFWLVKTDEYGNIPEFSFWTLLPFVFALSLIAVIFKEFLKSEY